MKALLICPAKRERVAALSETVPLSNVPILGKSLVEYWLEHLASHGAREVCILATDRPEQVRALVTDGSRWGLRVRVLPEIRELTPAEALAKFQPSPGQDWLPAPNHVRLMDCLPALPDFPLFTNYAGWFLALTQWLPQAASPERIGVREIKPGVWAGLHTRIAPEAELIAPCWLGENVRIRPGAVVGPAAVIENYSVVETHTKISHSVVGPGTYVGQFTELRHSIAQGSLLANWKLDSCIRVPDPFLLSSLDRTRSRLTSAGWLGRLLALLVMLLTLPVALLAIVTAKLRGLPAFRPRIAVRPQPAGNAIFPGDRLIYHELSGLRGRLRRWPQLWKIVSGDFSWVGNRPLTPHQAAHLRTEFERLWLAAPVGLISLADVEGCNDFQSIETRVHSSYFAVRGGGRLNWVILARALFLVVSGIPFSQIRERFTGVMEPEQLETRRAN